VKTLTVLHEEANVVIVLVLCRLGGIQAPTLASLLWHDDLLRKRVRRGTFNLLESLGLNNTSQFLVKSVGALED